MSRLTRSCSLLKRKNKKLYYEYIDFLLARKILDINSYWFFLNTIPALYLLNPFCWQIACIIKCARARVLWLESLLLNNTTSMFRPALIIFWGHFLWAVPKDITQHYLWDIMTCNCPHAAHPSSVAHRYYRLRPPVQSRNDASRCSPIRPIHYFSVLRFFVPTARQEQETIYNSIPRTRMLPFWKESDPTAIVWLRLRDVFLYKSFLWARYQGTVPHFGCFELDSQCFML